MNASPESTGTNPREVWKPTPLLGPVPAVLVTCQGHEGPPNIITIAWTGIVNSTPPMLSISVQPIRHSHRLIAETREFVVNLPPLERVRETDLCGVISGRDGDKFQRAGLTPLPSSEVRPPLIAECPVHLECRVRHTLDLGSHTMFVAEIVAVQVAKGLIEPDGRLAFEKAGLIAWAHGHYYTLGKNLGHFGFSVRKPDTPPRPLPSPRS